MKVICFDLWGTLMTSPGTGASYESVLTDKGVPQENIFPFVRDNLMTKRLSYEEMAQALFNNFQVEPKVGEIKKLVELWSTDNKQAEWISGTLEVVRKLRAEGRVVVLVTNITKPSWNRVNDRFQLTSEFDYTYISCNEGFVKPNNKVWEKIESWFPTIPTEEFVMVGDREIDDLATPRERGWKVIHADNLKSLFKEAGPNPTTLLIDTNHQVDQGQLRSFGINPLNTGALTQTLALWKGWQTLNPETTLVVVPGNGGELITQQLIPKLSEKWISRMIKIHAKRIWTPGSEPKAVVDLIFPGKMILSVKDVILIDNVVASGVTIQTIYEQNKPWIPGAKWHTLTWLAQRSASFSGGIELIAASYCGNKTRREPIASISTLTSDKTVLTSFADRNFPKDKARIVKIFESL